jgi:bacterioferritin-associated ferredoxin
VTALKVDRCVCFEVSFATLKAYADRTGCGPDELAARFGCGRGCGLCIPYIRRMLETGRTAFDLNPPQDEADPPANLPL